MVEQGAEPAQILVITASGGVPDGILPGAKRCHDSWVERPWQGPLPDLAGVDVNLVPAEAREKRLLIADMDSTMIGCECIDELADFAGCKAEVAAVTEAAMQGEIGFAEALHQRVACLRGITDAQIAQCRAERVRANPGAASLVQTMVARGAVTALISGGFTPFADPVGAELGFAEVTANRLESREGVLTGRVLPPIIDAEAKRLRLRALSAAHDLAPAQTLAVGDGANDAQMVEAAGLGVAYRAKPALKAVADARLDHSDLTALLALQGIPAASWINRG